jgi:hypothetical protein
MEIWKPISKTEFSKYYEVSTKELYKNGKMVDVYINIILLKSF